MHWLLVGAALLATVPVASAAPLDPEAKSRYELKVLIRIGQHRLLTPGYCDRLRLDLGDSLRAALGPLAAVEVIDPGTRPPSNWEPLWKEVEAKGLDALDAYRASSEGARTVEEPTPKSVDPKLARTCTGVKTHFVRIDYRDGQYEIATRQHDGSTGLASPLVRRARTADRAFLARLAGLLIGRDFGLVGTVVRTEKDEVTVRFKAGGLGGSLGDWVQKGDVFALSRIAAGPQKGTRQGKLVPSALLQVVDGPKEDGTAVCKLYTRLLDPLQGGLGYRCLKLGTTTAPLRLRLVDKAGNPAPPNLQVQAGADDFPGADAKGKKDLVPLRNHEFQSDGRTFAHLAFVRVTVGGATLARIPIELLDDRAIVCAIDLTPGAELLGELIARRDRCLSGLAESMQVQRDTYKQVTGKLDRPATAKQLTEQSLATLEADLARHTREVGQLREDTRGLPADRRAAVTKACDERLAELRNHRAALRTLGQRLDEAIKAANDPKIQAKNRELQERVTRAQALEQQAEFEEALKLYESVLKEAPDAKEVKDRVEKLRPAWKIASPEHAKARAFVYDTWAKAETAEQMRGNLKQAQEAFALFQKVGDKLTPRKLYLANAELIDRRLPQEVQALAKLDDGEEKAVKAKDLAALLQEIKQLQEEVKKYVNAGQPAEKPEE